MMFAKQEGVYVYGLFLEGAGWDRRNSRLCESANKVLYVLMPVIHIFALHNTPDKSPKLYQVRLAHFNATVITNDMYNDNATYHSNAFFSAQCPVYKKPQRTYMLLITPLWLQTLKNPDYWILRGVALLCDNK